MDLIFGSSVHYYTLYFPAVVEACVKVLAKILVNDVIQVLSDEDTLELLEAFLAVIERYSFCVK